MEINQEWRQKIADIIEDKGLMAEKESKSWPEGTHQHDYRLGMAAAFQECLELIQRDY